jgi:hypothetical protein
MIPLRQADDAQAFLLGSLWMQRVMKPNGASVKSILEWTLEVCSTGQPLPPPGIIADLGAIVYGLPGTRFSRESLDLPGWTNADGRRYEDQVLGKVYADWTFERASDALRRYTGRDQARGLAYLIKVIQDQARIGGVELSPAVIRGLLQNSGEASLNQGFALLEQAGPSPELKACYEEWISAFRRVAELILPEQVIAIEQRIALAEMGEYVAHQQILAMTARFEQRLPMRPVRPLQGRREVPTRVLDEDQYPVGGYSSISNRGSIESLLHSQLAFMETAEQPDLFDVKFVRDELFFYSRDENQFLRKRRSFVMIMDPSLLTARFKDAELPYQRIVLVQSLVLTLIRKLADWLSSDAIQFTIIFPRMKSKPHLADEVRLFQVLLTELRAIGVVEIVHLSDTDPSPGVPESTMAALEFCEREARQAQVHGLVLSQKRIAPTNELAVIACLAVDGPVPQLTDGRGEEIPLTEDDALDAWYNAVMKILQLWV